MTPCVERLAMRIGLSPSTGVRMVLPASVTSMIWSSALTGKEAISLPFRSFTTIATMPFPPRRVMRYSKDEVRLP